MINLIDLAPNGTFRSGQLVGQHELNPSHELRWDGDPTDDRGFIRQLTNARLENGARNNVLQMHPKRGSRGSIKAWLPWRRLPPNAIMVGWIGFLNGATGTDGVNFQVWEHHNSGGREVWNKVFQYQKGYDRNLVEFEIDLTHLSNTNVGIELRIDGGENSGQDWAVWVNPIIRSARNERTPPSYWRIRPDWLRVLSRNETKWFEGRGDEPYLGAIYFRSIFGKSGSTKVIKLDKLMKLGDNLREDQAVMIPSEAELNIVDTGVTWNNASLGFANGVQVMGYHVVAIEEDRRGRQTVRQKLDEAYTLLNEALKTHIEENPNGILNPDETIANIENAVTSISSNGSSRPFLHWLFRGDDEIGQNRIVMIGYNEETLRNQMGDDYNPESRDFPIGALSRRRFEIDFAGKGAHYRLNIILERSPVEITSG